MSTNTVVKPSGAGAPPFALKTVKELYDAKEEEADYCVEELLLMGSFSMLAGKPKAGKTTLARQLAVTVAQGKQFLGRDTRQGKVIYIAIEEKESEVTAHFRLLGLKEDDPVRIICGSVPQKEVVDMLRSTLQENPDVVLVIIDPIFRFVSVSDANDYTKVTDALGPLMDLARKSGVSIFAVHHMKKRETEYGLDSVLGSTAITGSVDTFIMLAVNSRGDRTLSTIQRYGTSMEPTELLFDPDTRELSLGLSHDAAKELQTEQNHKRILKEMIDYVGSHPGCTQEAIFNAVTGKSTVKRKVFQSLRDWAHFVTSGSGVKGAPYTFVVREDKPPEKYVEAKPATKDDKTQDPFVDRKGRFGLT